MKHTLLIAALAASLALPAQAFRAENDHMVVPQDGNTFLVPYRGESGAPAFWCAASDYARRGLGASNDTRIYRVSEPPRRSGQGVVFSLDPTKAASKSGLLILGQDDASQSVFGASLLCESRLPVRS